MWLGRIHLACLKGRVADATALLDFTRVRKAGEGKRLLIAAHLFIGYWEYSMSNPAVSSEMMSLARDHFTEDEISRARLLGLMVGGTRQGWLWAEEYSDVSTRIYGDDYLLGLLDRGEVDKCLSLIKPRMLPDARDPSWFEGGNPDLPMWNDSPGQDGTEPA
jgi:hypothetical protein